MKKTNLKITKAQAISKLKSVRTRLKTISNKSFLTNMLNSIGNYLFKLLHLNKLDKKTVLFIIFILRATLKVGVYTNLSIALLVYISQILDLEHKFTWELYLYIVYMVYYFIRDFIFDLSNRIYSIFRSLMERFITNLHEVKATVDSKHNTSITQQAKEAYKSLKDNDKLDSVQPSIETRYKIYKIVGSIVAIAAVAGSIYYGYIHFDEVKTFFSNTFQYITMLPGKIGRFIKKLFKRGGGGAGGGVATDNPVHEHGYYMFELGDDELVDADLTPAATQSNNGLGSYSKTTANIKNEDKSNMDYFEEVQLNDRGSFVNSNTNPWFSSSSSSSSSSSDASSSSTATGKTKTD